MKKHFILLSLAALILTTGVVTASEYTKFSRKFIKNFRDCDKYTETTRSEFEGETFTTTRRILGWKNGACRYEETMRAPSGEYLIKCAFPHMQVDELYSAMKDKSKEPTVYSLEIYQTQVDEKNKEITYKVVDTREIKGNKAYITWAKYENSPYFCTPEPQYHINNPNQK